MKLISFCASLVLAGALLYILFSATYTNGEFNVTAINFEAAAGTAHGDFIIEQEAMQNINDYIPKMFRVGANGLIKTVKPGFTFNNLTLYPIVFKLNGIYGLFTELNINSLEKKFIEYSSGTLSFNVYVLDESGAKLLPLTTSFNTTYFNTQYTGKPKLLSTEKEKSTCQIAGG